MDTTTDDRLQAAIEAGAKALHDKARDKKYLRWESCSEDYKEGLRQVARPIVEAALGASDRFLARVTST